MLILKNILNYLFFQSFYRIEEFRNFHVKIHMVSFVIR